MHPRVCISGAVGRRVPVVQYHLKESLFEERVFVLTPWMVNVGFKGSRPSPDRDTGTATDPHCQFWSFYGAGLL